LPYKVDNSELKYLNRIISQEHSTCGQSSGEYYCFTYEMNRARNAAADSLKNGYSDYYCWNLLNGGRPFFNGVSYLDSWDVIKANGIPDMEVYGGSWPVGTTGWMTGYDKYYSGMHNRISAYYKIDVSTPEGLQILKHWLHDHLDGSSDGGAATFYASVPNFIHKLPYGTEEGGKDVVTYWFSYFGHAMTIVGYNDSIKFDYNGDGQYTNDVDLNGDSIISVADMETGGLRFVNSYGDEWCDSGYCYMMYKTLAEIWDQSVHVIQIDEEYSPLLTIKTRLEHTSRKNLRITAGISENINDTIPAFTMEFPLFNFMGGDQYMQGDFNASDSLKQIEIGLDVTRLLGAVSPGSCRLFLGITDISGINIEQGIIHSFSVYNYQYGKTEYQCPETEVIMMKQRTAYMSVLADIEPGYDVQDELQITTASLPVAEYGKPFEVCLDRKGGIEPYYWKFRHAYFSNTMNASMVENGLDAANLSGAINKYERIGLPFNFPFYGVGYDSLTMYEWGYISLESEPEDAFSYPYAQTESERKPQVVVFGGNDLRSYPVGGIWKKITDHDAYFRWKARVYPNIYDTVNFALKIDSSGTIEMYYGDICTSIEWYAGLSDDYEMTYSPVQNFSGPAGNKAVRFYPDTVSHLVQLSEDGVITSDGIRAETEIPLNIVLTDLKNFSYRKEYILKIVRTPDPVDGLLVYPNPFNGSVSFSFHTVNYSKLFLEIHDIFGRIIYQANQEYYTGGNNTIEWNARTGTGSAVAPGVYLYNVILDGKRYTGRVVYMQ
ncbi:MAG: T9SS type A sorting domain-containing protein, partial [Bacteroidota bacterium]